MLKRTHYGHVFLRKMLKTNSLKMLKNAKTASFVFLALKSYFLNISIYGLLLVNCHGQIYPGQQSS